MSAEPIDHGRERPLDLSPVLDSPAWDRVASSYAEVIAGHLSNYAADAIRLAELRAGEAALDVATGPGTLARLAARITRVNALDFSPQMLEALRRAATPQERANLVLQQGDGQALPYDDASFDVAFSMFGLFLFEDRQKAFSELARVVRPGGRAVVGSWQPPESTVVFAAIRDEVVRECGMQQAPEPPLARREDLVAEMGAAGFRVEVHACEHTLQSASLAELWQGVERSHVVLRIAADQLTEDRYATMVGRIYERLQRELGDGPQQTRMPAWLALGHRQPS